ncbi:MAG: glycoside hydrolase family 30 protein [Solirubrobacterales bacterium]
MTRRAVIVCQSLIVLTAVLGLVHESSARDVRIWQTRFDDGTQRERALDISAYSPDQDADYELLREMPAPTPQSSPAQQIGRIEIDLRETRQTVKGLGASLTDASAYVLAQLQKKNPSLYAYAMERLFSADKGAGFSFLRLPMGSSDYTATDRYYTYADEPSADLSTFSIEHDKEYIIPMLKEAIRINPEIELMGSPWSPPAWMKTNGSLTGITKEEKAAGKICRLKPECFDLYAEYFARYVQAYREQGIAIHAITLQNEPQFDAARYPCMRLPVEDEARLAALVGRKLAERGLATKIFAHDHNWVLHPNDRQIIGGDRKMDPLERVTKLFTDDAAGPYVAGSAWHCYSGSIEDMQRVYGTLHERFTDRPIFCTEISAWRDTSRKEWFGDVQWGLRANWLGTFQNWGSASLEWNLVLDHKYGPTLRDDSLAIGLVTVDSDTYNSVKCEREYYAMAHVSKAARPGATCVKTSVTGAGAIEAAAFHLKTGQISLVTFNPDSVDRPFEVVCGECRFAYTLPARSVATFLWNAVTL